MNEKSHGNKNSSHENRKGDAGRKDDSKKAPATDPGPKDSPKQHEEAPGRNPVPNRPTVDDSGRVRRDPEGENPDEEG